MSLSVLDCARLTRRLRREVKQVRERRSDLADAEIVCVS